jgi:ParB-like chromosome segregation protein Spo0J
LVNKVERVPIGSVTLHPRNARRGDVRAIQESLRANGLFAPIVVQRSTGHVLSGNHTLRAARNLEWDTIDVVYVDVDDARAVKILLAANRTADLGEYDEQALVALLTEAAENDAGSEGALLYGTGYTDADLVKLLGHDEVMPEAGDADTEAIQEAWALVVHCADEAEQTSLLERFTAEGLDVKALIT